MPRRPRENMQALLFAADRFRSVLTDPKLPSHWNQMQPFLGWVDLFNLFLSNADKIKGHYRGAPAPGTNLMPAQRSLLYKLMELYPHFAMICTVHQNPADNLLYAGLQLQCLHAHWTKVDAFRRRVPLADFYSPESYKDEIRCDTHPRFSRDGHKVVVDSPHGGNGRQMYLLDIAGVLKVGGLI